MANPNPMEKSMVSVVVAENAGGGGRRCCVVCLSGLEETYWIFEAYLSFDNLYGRFAKTPCGLDEFLKPRMSLCRLDEFDMHQMP
jgi:hypothetical protein